MSTFGKYASIGDAIECDVQEPFPQTLRVVLKTPEAVAFANGLIATGRWRKSEVKQEPRERDEE